MKSSIVLATTGLLLVAANLGSQQVESLKTVAKGAVGQSSLEQQEQDFRQEELRQHQQIEQLRQQQRDAELQIQQQNEEAQRHLAQTTRGAPLLASGLKGSDQFTSYSRPLNTPSLWGDHMRQYVPNNQYGIPPQSTIAYLVVRPPYATPLSHYETEANYRNNYAAALLRPSYLTSGHHLVRHHQQQQQQQQLQTEAAWGTKGGARQPEPELVQQQQQLGEHEEQRPLEQRPLEQRPLEQQPLEQRPLEQQPILHQQGPQQPALVVPVHAGKEGKLKAMLDKILSKFALGTASYTVTNEEMLYPQQQQALAQGPLVQSQQPIEQQQQQHIPEEELRLPQQQQQQLHLDAQRPLEQTPPLQQEQQQQQGFGEEQERPSLVASNKSPQLEHARQPTTGGAKSATTEQDQDQLQLLQQQQTLSEQEINRQPIKGSLQQQQLPIRQPEPIQQQQQQPLLETKSRRPLQEPIRQQEAKNPTAGF